MRYQKLAQLYEDLSSTTKRLEKTKILSDFLKHLSEEDKDVMYLLMGDIYPEYSEKKIGISNQLAIQAISKATGTEKSIVVKEWKKIGDLGKVSELLIQTKKQSTLHSHIITTKKVIENLRKLPELIGKGTVGKKLSLITELLTSATPIEAKYLVRTLIGDLRVGIKEPTIRDAMISAFFNNNKEYTDNMQRALDRANDVTLVFTIAKKGKIKDLKKISLEVGKPIKAMLAQKAENIKEGFKMVGKPCGIEYKYDGFRCITGNTAIYTKNKGILSVKNIKINDEVLTHKGKFRKVIAINKRKIDKDEKLYKIQSYLGNEFRITEKHPIFIFRNNKFRWILSENITKKDELAFPLTKIQHPKTIIKKQLKLKNTSGYKKIIPVNEFFFRFLGYWIGDGFTNNFHNTERVGLIFNQKKERKLCNYYKKNIIKYFGIKNISENIHNGAIYLYWRDKPLRIWLSNHFRREWKGKIIPDWFFGITKNQFKVFLKGWIESDGHIDGLGRTSITTKERDTAMSVQLLALKFKKIIGIKKLRIKEKDYYKIIIPKTERKCRIHKNYVLLKILKYEQIKRPDPRINLYNLQIDRDESYCTTMITLHNCLIHKQGNELKLFTRRLENVSKQFPEVVKYINKYVKADSFIIDAEAVGYHKKTKEYTSFQHISQRIRRKYHIDKLQKELPVELNVFDILYLNGKSVIDEPYENRTKLLRSIIKKHPYKIIPSKMIITGNEKKAEKFYKAALKDNQEGIMMKNLKARYQPGRRVGHMIKVKPEERDLDLVITGAEYGTGKRSGWMSSFILSCKGKKKGEFLEIGKVGTGIKEKREAESGGISFDELTEKLTPLITKEKAKNVKLKPKLVVSVTYQEIQRSPNYNSGWALRFPRLTALRPDKPLNEVADLKEVEKDFKNQKRNWKYG